MTGDVIRGRFVRDAPYVIARVTGPGFRGGLVRFLVDTGASKTLLQARDIRRLGVSPADLIPAPIRLAGIGGATSPFVLSGAVLTFRTAAGGDYDVRADVYALPSSPGNINLPAVLGRDVVNQFALRIDYRSRIVELRP